jgi:hypothetical protein
VEQTDLNAGLEVASDDDELDDDLGDASKSGTGFVWHWLP